jgi:nitrate/nitrite-specific signal transduction histidine kinase
MRGRLAVWLGSLLALVALAGADAAAGADPGPPASLTSAAAINKAGRQRMLSQRLAKAYLMIGQEIQPERGTTIRDESTALFDRQLAELRGFAPSEDVRKALVQLERSWAQYKPALGAPPSAKGAREIYDLSEAVQGTAHRLTLAYERAAGRPVDRLVNIAGRQRMLSQRMAKHYLFMTWNVNAHAAQMELGMARAEFSSGMHQLAAAAHDDAIAAELAVLDREWSAYHAALGARRDAAALRRAAPEIVDLSERVLERTERLVALFEKRATTSP